MTVSTQQSRVRTRIIPKKWDELVSSFLRLRPIRNDATHEKAIAILKAIALLPDLNKAQSDYFEVLSDLVVKYENKHWAIDTSDVSAIDILKSFIEDHEMTASDLGRLIGNDRTLGHKILTGKRKLTTDQIKILSNKFKVSTDLFIE